MPLHKIISINQNSKLYLWKITEDFNTLFRAISLKDVSLARLESMKSEEHQKGFLAVRMLLQNAGYNDFDLYYDDSGKPNLKMEDGRWKMEENTLIQKENHLNSQLETRKLQHISISHSHEFSAIVISDKKVGLDLEKCKEKTLIIAPRFMDVSHLENVTGDEKIKKATVIWGIKESIFKIKSEEGISFQNHIFEDDFNFEDKKANAILKFNNNEEFFSVVFDTVEDYIYVCAFEK